MFACDSDSSRRAPSAPRLSWSLDWASCCAAIAPARTGDRKSLAPRAVALLAAAALFLAPVCHAGAVADQASPQKNPASSTDTGEASSGASRSAGTAPAARHDHVGQPLPDYMTGDQCLFCHRNVVGPTWEQEPHAWTIRPVGGPPAVGHLPPDATHVIGSPQHYRALKLIGYGTFAVLAADGKTWQPDVFATQCAGCHTTGVDPKSHAFSAFAFDCYACHGDLSTDHTTKPEIAWLGTKRPRQPKEIVAICAQCHLRGGRSQSTGFPYPNNFIAGDDLFADFKVDLKRDLDPNMNPADRHAYTYTRRVMEGGSTQTCLECHRVHGRPDLKHEYCIDCDDLPGAKAAAAKLRSETCQY
jgi:hypothetical protein